ncbi:hypothetical protein [Vibrio cholerae]|uniref:hypothetical protein n=1 Tax=Vibrio cholerae TaxID=666 RepID=UPI003D6C20AC
MFKVLIHERSKDVKILPDGGFDLTVLLFGVFVPLWRGQYKRALSYLAIVICTLFVAWLFIPFFSNKHYIKDLLEKDGYLLVEDYTGIKPVIPDTSPLMIMMKDFVSWFMFIHVLLGVLGLFIFGDLLLAVTIIALFGLGLALRYHRALAKHQAITKYNEVSNAA